MKKLNINGHEVLTNYPGGWTGYPIDNKAYAHKNSVAKYQKGHESDEQMLERLVSLGYTKIAFYETTTRVKGYHNLVAYCSKPVIREKLPKFEKIYDYDGELRGYKLDDWYLMKIYTWNNVYSWVINKDGRRHYSQVDFSNALATGEIDTVASCKEGKQRLIALNKVETA